MKFEKVPYRNLNAKQQEKYNYQKVSAVLADYGFTTIPLSDDWLGADFLAVHKDGQILKVQLKGRMTLDNKYLGKELYICFPSEGLWYIYPHDEMLEKLGKTTNILNTESWRVEGKYSFPTISAENRLHLRPFELAA